MKLVHLIITPLAIVTCLAPLHAQRPVFRSETDIISIPVSVMSGRKPVTGLKASDFAIRDNGVPQEIQDVYAATVPLDVTLVIDTSGSVDGAKAAIGRDLQRIADRLDKDDRLRVLAMDVATHEDVAMQPMGPEVLKTFEVRGGITSVHDAILAVLLQPPSPGRRQVAIVITDGYDTASQTSPSTLVELGEIPGPALHVILVTPAQMSPEIGEISRRVWMPAGDFAVGDLQKTASKTGGALHKTGLFQKGAAAFEIDVLRTFRQSYLLMYSPKGVDTPGVHQVGVSIPRHSDYEITARRSYEK
jgi:hypothetical protein